MSKYHKLLAASALGLCLAVPAYAEKYDLGRPALPEEIAAWDLDVAPDGTGLPEGSGDVFTGEEVFAEHCAICHGDFAEGVDNWPKLAGGDGTLADEDPLKTVGSYWPYLSTVWDYVNRSMPFGNAQSLESDDVYAMVAYMLYSNNLVDEEFTLSHENFLEVEMPNANGFIVDDREITEAHFWTDEPCMTDCRESVEITMRAVVLDVTPDETEANAAGTQSVVQESSAEVEEDAKEAALIEETAALDPEMIESGKKVFKKCKSCHQIGEGAKHRTGPALNGIMGAQIGAIEEFKYSKVMKAAASEGLVWTDEDMAAFLAKPKAYMKGTRMSFVGLRKQDDIDAVIVYLKSFGG